MPAIKFINRLKKIDQLIKLKATGSPKQLAEKLEITERQVYNYLDNLKELGADIKFDKLKNSYTYTSDIELVIAYKKK
jgi:predicted DNA-binding transcriptional regulator YafY